MLNKLEALAEEVKELKSATTPAVIKGIQGIADFLGVSESVAQKMKNEGVIPCIQYDRVVLFEPVKVLAALSQTGCQALRESPIFQVFESSFCTRLALNRFEIEFQHVLGMIVR